MDMKEALKKTVNALEVFAALAVFFFFGAIFGWFMTDVHYKSKMSTQAATKSEHKEIKQEIKQLEPQPQKVKVKVWD